MSGIQLPGRVQVGVVEHENGQAFPSSTGIGQQFHIFGGLTKLEYVSALVASGGVYDDFGEMSCFNDRDAERHCSPSRCGEIAADQARNVVSLAEAILAECAARQAKDSPPTA